MNIVLSKHAENQLDTIYDFIKVKNERAAIAIYNEIVDEIERLKSFPQIAAIEPLLADFAKTYRSLVVRSTYKVIYYTEYDTVYISAIWDCRQNPDKLRTEIWDEEDL
ncbi:MAG: type II toxin-antitoxin system RelE/ParE family toxin [Candidatus Symbiothrix sp.]|jgi:plasmid stabilization system protein ParE|nr:type II toxin-antitoxin system RelE/ParE family toxin [Candidatus Symbiothrix sp.]